MEGRSPRAGVAGSTRSASPPSSGGPTVPPLPSSSIFRTGSPRPRSAAPRGSSRSPGRSVEIRSPAENVNLIGSIGGEGRIRPWGIACRSTPRTSRSAKSSSGGPGKGSILEFRTPNQVLGRRSTIGCVALEITQRCNLDCTLCYLSESSESVKDLPLDASLRAHRQDPRDLRPRHRRAGHGRRPDAAPAGGARRDRPPPRASAACAPRCSPTASGPRATCSPSSRAPASSTSPSTSTRRSASRSTRAKNR